MPWLFPQLVRRVPLALAVVGSGVAVDGFASGLQVHDACGVVCPGSSPS